MDIYLQVKKETNGLVFAYSTKNKFRYHYPYLNKKLITNK